MAVQKQRTMMLHQKTRQSVLMIQVLLHDFAVALRYKPRIIRAHVCDKARAIRNAQTLLLQWVITHALHIAECPAGVEHNRDDVIASLFRNK